LILGRIALGQVADIASLTTPQRTQSEQLLYCFFLFFGTICYPYTVTRSETYRQRLDFFSESANLHPHAQNIARTNCFFLVTFLGAAEARSARFGAMLQFLSALYQWISRNSIGGRIMRRSSR
jgi:hypothetical protein